MGHKRNTISDEEHKERSLRIIRNYNGTKADCEEMYFLYNDRMEPREQYSNCGKCRARVFNRLKQFYGQ